jgi:hypothetical protein
MSIIFTGDVILDRGIKDEIRLHGDSLLVNAIKKTGKSDFLVVNYEGTFTKSDIAQNDLYNFKTGENGALLLKQSGITHVSIANNHIYDFGQIGYENTIDALAKNQLVTIGESCEPELLEKGNAKCAILSVSLTSNNDSLCISTIDQLKNSVRIFKSQRPAIPLILYIHWGLELQPDPEIWQRKLASDLVKSGVDAIIGHHPHVTQTIEFINDKPVFYSIGNFVWDTYLTDTDKSFTVELTVTNKITDIKIRPILIYRYFPKLVNPKDQISSVTEYLSHSEGICAIKMNDAWMIKSIGNVNFQENANLWIFSEDKTVAAIKTLQSGSQLLTLFTQGEKSNTVSLHGRLSRLLIADINNDGFADILIQISKKVHFDPEIKKRINIYTYQNQNLQPLWLGTKFVYNIESFNIGKSENLNYLTTLETDENGNRFQGVYKWDDFGFALSELNQIKTNEKY